MLSFAAEKKGTPPFGWSYGSSFAGCTVRASGGCRGVALGAVGARGAAVSAVRAAGTGRAVHRQREGVSATVARSARGGTAGHSRLESLGAVQT